MWKYSHEPGLAPVISELIICLWHLSVFRRSQEPVTCSCDHSLLQAMQTAALGKGGHGAKHSYSLSDLASHDFDPNLPLDSVQDPPSSALLGSVRSKPLMRTNIGKLGEQPVQCQVSVYIGNPSYYFVKFNLTVFNVTFGFWAKYLYSSVKRWRSALSTGRRASLANYVIDRVEVGGESVSRPPPARQICSEKWQLLLVPSQQHDTEMYVVSRQRRSGEFGGPHCPLPLDHPSRPLPPRTWSVSPHVQGERTPRCGRHAWWTISQAFRISERASEWFVQYWSIGLVSGSFETT